MREYSRMLMKKIIMDFSDWEYSLLFGSSSFGLLPVPAGKGKDWCWLVGEDRLVEWISWNRKVIAKVITSVKRF